MSLSRPARNFGAVVSEPTARGQAPLPGLRRSVRGARRVFRQVAREDRGFCYHAIDREKLDREDQAHYTGAPRRARVLALYLRDGPFVRRGPAEVSDRIAAVRRKNPSDYAPEENGALGAWYL